uniref:Uncharacterized protein n=1 Tax=Arundo donax TaxID=35708 RepID=A0A0A9G7J7_ARUDO
MKLKVDGRCYISTVCIPILSCIPCCIIWVLSTGIHRELGKFTRTTRR